MPQGKLLTNPAPTRLRGACREISEIPERRDVTSRLRHPFARAMQFRPKPCNFQHTATSETALQVRTSVQVLEHREACHDRECRFNHSACKFRFARWHNASQNHHGA